MKRLAILLVLAALPASAQISIKGGGGSSGGSISTPVSIANGGTGNANGDGLLATCTDSVGTDAYACSSTSTPGCPASLAASEPVLFVAGTANTGAATFAYCGLTAKALVKTVGGISTALATGDILAKQPVLVRYNATDDDWKMISAVSTSAAGGSLTVGGAITSGTVTRFLYEDGSNQLAESAAAVIASSGAVTLGTGLSGTAVPLTVNNGTSTGDIVKFQSAGSDLVRIADDGLLYVTDSGIRGTTANTVLRWFSGGFYIQTGTGGNIPFYATSSGMQVGAGQGIAWTGSGNDATSTIDTQFQRVSAGVVRMTDNTTAAYRALLGGGAAVASATALPLPTGRVFHVTGTTNITSITSTNFESGVVITLIFDDVLTFSAGVIAGGTMVTTANDTLTLVYDGTSWYEISRSVN